MIDDMAFAPELIPVNVYYMQEMIYLAQGAEWETCFDASETFFDDEFEGV